nr:hypothetical protein [Candidatus Anoxychlamydiales bacterium]
MKKILFILSFFVSFQLFSSQKFLPSPYNTITNVLPKLDHGWFLNAKSIEKLFAENEISTVIELGSWLGKSTIFMAQRLHDNGKIYAVDHWKGSLEYSETQERKTFLPTLYEQFLSNVIHAKQTNKIIPIKQSTYDAFFTLDVKADLIYI